MTTALSQLTTEIKRLEREAETRYKDYPQDFEAALRAIKNNEIYALFLNDGPSNNEDGVCTSFNILARKVNLDLCVPETRRIDPHSKNPTQQKVQAACKNLTAGEARLILAQILRGRTAGPTEAEMTEALGQLKGELHTLASNAKTLFWKNPEGLECALLIIKGNEKYAPFFTAGQYNNQDKVGEKFNEIAKGVGKPELYVEAPIPEDPVVATSLSQGWWGSRALGAVRGAVSYVYATTTAGAGWLINVMSWTPAEKEALVEELQRKANEEEPAVRIVYSEGKE